MLAFKQISLANTFRKCSTQRAAAIMHKIAEFVDRNLRALSVIDGDGFKQLMNYLEPGYKVYTIETIYEIN